MWLSTQWSKRALRSSELDDAGVAGLSGTGRLATVAEAVKLIESRHDFETYTYRINRGFGPRSTVHRHPAARGILALDLVLHFRRSRRGHHLLRNH